MISKRLLTESVGEALLRALPRCARESCTACYSAKSCPGALIGVVLPKPGMVEPVWFSIHVPFHPVVEQNNCCPAAVRAPRRDDDCFLFRAADEISLRRDSLRAAGGGIQGRGTTIQGRRFSFWRRVAASVSASGLVSARKRTRYKVWFFTVAGATRIVC